MIIGEEIMTINMLIAYAFKVMVMEETHINNDQ